MPDKETLYDKLFADLKRSDELIQRFGKPQPVAPPVPETIMGSNPYEKKLSLWQRFVGAQAPAFEAEQEVVRGQLKHQFKPGEQLPYEVFTGQIFPKTMATVTRAFPSPAVLGKRLATKQPLAPELKKLSIKSVLPEGTLRKEFEAQPIIKQLLAEAPWYLIQGLAVAKGMQLTEIGLQKAQEALLTVAVNRWGQRLMNTGMNEKQAVDFLSNWLREQKSYTAAVVKDSLIRNYASSQNSKQAAQATATDIINKLEPVFLAKFTPGGSAVPGQTMPLAQMQTGMAMQLKPEGLPQPTPGQVTPEVTKQITVTKPTLSPTEYQTVASQTFRKMRTFVGQGGRVPLDTNEVESLRQFINKNGDLTNPNLGIAEKIWTGDIEIIIGVFGREAEKITGGKYLVYDVKHNTFGTHSTEPSLTKSIQSPYTGKTVSGKLTPTEFQSRVKDWLVGKVNLGEQLKLPTAEAGIPVIPKAQEPVTPSGEVAPAIAEPPSVPTAQPPTAVSVAQPEPQRLTTQLRTMYGDLKTETDAFRAAVKGMRGAEAQVSRQTLVNMERELKLVTETLKRFETKQPFPDLKGLRQQIVALSVYKGFNRTQLRQILKDNTGTASLRQIPESQLQSVLQKIQRIRPEKIQGKTVINLDTERDIQSLRQSLVADGTLDKDSYTELLKYANLRTDKYENAERYITESEGRQFIKTMNKEARLGYAQRQANIKTALTGKPKIADVVNGINTKITNLQVGIAGGKKASVNPFLDMRYYTQKLQATTAQPFYDVWYMALNKRWDLNAQSKQIMDELAKSTTEFTKIAQDEQALARINQYIVAKNKLADVQIPTSITPEEIKVANAIEKTLYDFRNDVRYYRFLRSYNRNNGDIELLSREIPNAPKEDLREAVKILESKGDKALRTYTDNKTWGVIQSGYEPEVAIDPSLLERRARMTALGAGHLQSREELAFDKQDRNILQRTSSYVKQVLNLQLEPYLQKMDEMYGASIDTMSDARSVKRQLQLAINGLKGYGEDVGELGRIVRNIGSQLLRIRFLLPDKAFRNALQNLAFHPDREAFVNPTNRKLNALEMADFENKVASTDAFAQDYLMRSAEGLGHKGLNRQLDRVSLFPLSERMNRLSGYWASLNKAERALQSYQKDGNVTKFLTSSSLNDLTPLQQKHGLELVATDETEAVRFIAREIVNNTHMVYTKFEKAPAQMGAIGETLGSLMTFPRSYVQRMSLQWQTLVGKTTPSAERMRAFKVLSGTLIFGTLASAVYKAVTGKDQDPYNPFDIISWTPGGVAVGATTQVTDLLYTISQALQGDRDALLRIPTKLTQAGDSFIPYYEPVINGLESLTDSQQVDRRALREIIAVLKKDYHPNEEYYKKKRSLIDKFRHVVFGGDTKETKTPVSYELPPSNVLQDGRTAPSPTATPFESPALPSLQELGLK